MAGLFKDRFNHESLYELALEIQAVYAGFQVEAFLHTTMDKTWDSLEFKQRVARISENLWYAEICAVGDGIINAVMGVGFTVFKGREQRCRMRSWS